MGGYQAQLDLAMKIPTVIGIDRNYTQDVSLQIPDHGKLARIKPKKVFQKSKNRKLMKKSLLV